MYILELERVKGVAKQGGNFPAENAIVVRLLHADATTPEMTLLAEALYSNGLPEGLSLKADVPFAALRLETV